MVPVWIYKPPHHTVVFKVEFEGSDRRMYESVAWLAPEDFVIL